MNHSNVFNNDLFFIFYETILFIAILVGVGTIVFAVYFWLSKLPVGIVTIKKLTGWEAAFRKYPLQSEFTGEWLSSQEMNVPWAIASSFTYFVDIGFDPEFLYIKWDSDVGQIPWTCVKWIGKSDSSLFKPGYVFVIQEVPWFKLCRNQALDQYLEHTIAKSTIDELMISL